jgi:hypothetical protein
MEVLENCLSPFAEKRVDCFGVLLLKENVKIRFLFSNVFASNIKICFTGNMLLEFQNEILQ